MPTEAVEYTADGLHMVGHLALPEGMEGKRPGILVFPEIFGLSQHAINRANRLAEHGYVALAGDLHGDRLLNEDLDAARKLAEGMRADVTKIRARAEGALQALLARPEVDAGRIGAIGFCFGGTMALELGRGGADVHAIVGFHSGLATPRPEDAKNIKGKVLVCIGADDPGVNADQRAGFEAEMRAAKVNWQMNVYGNAVHSFTNPEAGKMGRPEMAAYDEQTDLRSWAEMRRFLTRFWGRSSGHQEIEVFLLLFCETKEDSSFFEKKKQKNFYFWCGFNTGATSGLGERW